ncbi:PKHD-type hydroxylase YbiX [Comamonas faecalis]|uniref:PKHD-type hydroxylase YbiX n=1 Tax=Comamonas faecalis TaxID=1387849 RepID=A0ABP7R7A3_9BURK
MMLHIPGVLNTEQVQAIRRTIDAGPWVDGRTSVGDQGARVKRNHQLRADSDAALQARQLVLQALKSHAAFFAAALPLRIAPPMFNRYEGGETYGLHVDGAVRHEPDGWLRTDLSSTLFLCEPGSYEGGELEVMDTYGTHEVRLPAGDLILYPSSSLHQVRPVTAGARVCAVLWLQSMIRNEEQRSQLYELDQAIQSLRAKMGDGPETLSLSNHYHNLLRMWSEV